jgi:uroporphyrinogen-III decarboxylase
MHSLSPKENYLRALRHEETEYVPVQASWGFRGGDTFLTGFLYPLDTGDKNTSFRDAYGVRWKGFETVAGPALLPAPGEIILKDVTRWKKDITIPDVENCDWQKLAEQELFNIDRDKQVLYFMSTNSVWERLTSLMGFEEAMIALIEEPEACDELFTAITDYKIRMAEKVAIYYKADVFVHCDDIATELNLFMSPETYRKLIKPHHKRLCNAVRNLGMFPVQHTCGHAESLVEDFIETEMASWNSVQPHNDIVGLLDKYGEKFTFEGGFNSSGKPANPNASIEEVTTEVERCFREYGGRKGYILWLFADTLENAEEKHAAMLETANRLRFAGK